jgi:hypothetical protein
MRIKRAGFLCCLFLCLLLFTVSGYGKDIIPLPELQKPSYILIDENHLYVKERFSISIYSLKDFKLIKKFGKEGEGPQEFTRAINLDICDDYLAVISCGKISYFNRNGKFIRENRVPIEFFPDYFPVIRYLYISSDKIYVQTYKKENGKNEFFILNINGQLIKIVYLSIVKMYGDSFSYPFTVYNGNLYQLVDNDNLEEWELHITAIH